MSGGRGLPAQVKTALGGGIPTIPGELISIATTFVALQEVRHEADYDLGKVISRLDASRLVSRTAGAFADWNAVSGVAANADMCEVFLAALLLGERWKK